MPLKRSLAALSLVVVMALAGCAAGDEEPEQTDTPAGPEEVAPEADLEGVPEVVAVVNGEEISREEFAEAYEAQLQQTMMMQQDPAQELDEEALKQEVAQMLVNNLLLSQAAADAGIEATDEDIDTTLEEVATQNGMGSVDELIAALSEQGMSEEDIREEAAMQYQLTTYIDSATDVPEPSEDELREQYDTLIAQQEEMGEEAGEVPPFEEVRDQLAEQAVSQEQDVAVQELLEELQEQGDVTINL
ncbi:SurA N-terminal domain-containing protein [uncultured Agrococcus sp.]|uniref:SurA N-terminal domain-containing protein n=1 Tax=uncultured Agrococcus sp. TaxID=382258 RepID=UPI0025ED99FD|nr:SurA N-terminal domain-containing protein [uncultured Agrococcus sp.]